MTGWPSQIFLILILALGSRRCEHIFANQKTRTAVASGLFFFTFSRANDGTEATAKEGNNNHAISCGLQPLIQTGPCPMEMCATFAQQNGNAIQRQITPS